MTHTSIQNNSRIGDSVSLRDRLMPIGLLAFIFFLNILARFVWGPLLVHIEKELGISHAGAGALFIYVTVGYFAGIIVSGILSHKMNHRKTISISCYACGLLLVLASVSDSFLVFRIMLVGIGATAGLYLPSGIASLTYTLENRDFGKAFAIHEIAPSLSLLVGPIVVELAVADGSWRSILWPMGLILALSGLIYDFSDTTGEFRGDPLSIGNMRRVFFLPAFWVMLVIFMLGIVANMAIYSMLPLYLQVERGMGATYANLMVSIPRIPAMFSPYLAGWLVSRYGPRPVLMGIVLPAGLAVAGAGLFSNGWLWLPLIWQPLLASAIFPPAYAVLSGLVPAGLRNIIIVLLMPLAMLLGGGLFPAIIGAFGDAGRFHQGFLWIGLLIAASSFLALTMKGDAATNGSDPGRPGSGGSTDGKNNHAISKTPVAL